MPESLVLSEAAIEFKKRILKNLETNGYPDKKVSLPLEKLYESADEKGVNLNTILENLSNEHLIQNEKVGDKIIFSLNSDGINPEMLEKAQEAMAKMDPEQMKKIQEMVNNMDPKEREEMMEKAKKMGLV